MFWSSIKRLIELVVSRNGCQRFAQFDDRLRTSVRSLRLGITWLNVSFAALKFSQIWSKGSSLSLAEFRCCSVAFTGPVFGDHARVSASVPARLARSGRHQMLMRSTVTFSSPHDIERLQELLSLRR